MTDEEILLELLPNNFVRFMGITFPIGGYEVDVEVDMSSFTSALIKKAVLKRGSIKINSKSDHITKLILKTSKFAMERLEKNGVVE